MREFPRRPVFGGGMPNDDAERWRRCRGGSVYTVGRVGGERTAAVSRGTGRVGRESGCGCRGSVLAAASKVRLVPPLTHSKPRAPLAHACTPIGVLRRRQRRRSRYSRAPATRPRPRPRARVDRPTPSPASRERRGRGSRRLSGVVSLGAPPARRFCARVLFRPVVSFFGAARYTAPVRCTPALTVTRSVDRQSHRRPVELPSKARDNAHTHTHTLHTLTHTHTHTHTKTYTHIHLNTTHTCSQIYVHTHARFTRANRNIRERRD